MMLISAKPVSVQAALSVMMIATTQSLGVIIQLPAVIYFGETHSWDLVQEQVMES